MSRQGLAASVARMERSVIRDRPSVGCLSGFATVSGALVVRNIGGTMLRFAVSLRVGLFFFGSASAKIVTDPNAKPLNERLRSFRPQLQAKDQRGGRGKQDSCRAPERMQIAKLRAVAPNDRVAWYGAGRQSDGKTSYAL